MTFEETAIRYFTEEVPKGKYQRIDAQLRAQKRAEWNRPVVWPFALLILAGILLAWMGVRYWRRSESAVAISA